MIVFFLNILSRMSPFPIICFHSFLRSNRSISSRMPIVFFAGYMRIHSSEACKSALKTHAVKALSLLSIFNFVPFYLRFNEDSTPVAFRVFVLINSEQLFSHVRTLLRYSNVSTFSMVSPVAWVTSSIFLSPNTMIFVFSVLRSSLCSAAAFVCPMWLRGELISSSKRSIPSANLRLFIDISPMLITQLFWLIKPINRFRCMTKRNGDIGSLGLVPTTRWNHSSFSLPISTTD